MSTIREPRVYDYKEGIVIHGDLVNGHRQALFWNHPLLPYVQLQSPYPIVAVVDPDVSETAPTDAPFGSALRGIPCCSPSFLGQWDPQRTAIVTMAETVPRQEEIVQRVNTFGPFPVITPFLMARDVHALDASAQRRLEAPLGNIEGFLRQTRTRNQYVPVPRRACLWIHRLTNGGAERQIVLLALGLRRLGWEVDLLATNPDLPHTETWARDLESAKVLRHFLPRYKDFAWPRIFEETPERAVARTLAPFLLPAGLHEVVSATCILQARRPELLVTYLDDGNIGGGVAGIMAGVPRIQMFGRSVQPEQFPWMMSFPVEKPRLAEVYRALLRQRGVNLCNNTQVGAASYAAWLGTPAASISVVPNAVEMAPSDAAADAPAPLNSLPPDAPIVLGVMRFSSEKDPVGFLKTVALILQDRPDARAVLVGDGPLRGEVDVFLSHSGFASSVLLTGAVDRADGWMKRASVVVSTSHVEGMPNVLLEAQACGVPVVATDVGGTREALAPNLQEYVRPDSDWPGLANACLQLLNDAALRQREGAQALAWVRQARSLHALAENTLKAAPAP